MTELSGTLDGVGLPAIVRFLIGLKKSGSLRVSHADWEGQIVLEAGRVTSANLGSRKGLAALDALAELPSGANFIFESKLAGKAEQTIQLSEEALQAHLDELAARVARGETRLPSPDAIPLMVISTESEGETLPLDRGMLQTLLVIDGERSVRDIVARRDSVDALWQIASLVDVGLVELHAPNASASDSVEPEPVPTPLAAEVDPRFAAPSPVVLQPEPAATVHCPQLGFEDDPSNSFARPTRLHRCFATGKPLALSIDQQRELCLSEQFGTCPRLATATAVRPAAAATAAAAAAPATAPRADAEPRIVRLPFGAARAARTERVAPVEAAATSSVGARPTPLRARLQRPTETHAEPARPVSPAAAATVLETPIPPPIVRQPRPAQAPPTERVVPEPLTPVDGDSPIKRRLARIPLWAMGGVGVVAIVGIATVLLLQANTLFSDQSIDPSTLPNTSRVAAGTPVSVVTSARANPAAQQPTAAPVIRPTVAPTAGVAAAAPQPPAGIFFDEHFINNDAGWVNDPQGVASLSDGSYRLRPQQAGVSVAIDAPITNIPPDVVVSATFRKFAGPSGGGYGIIVHDQASSLRDGASQDGQYYVLEVGDKGEIGIWRRDSDHWIDLLPWQHSDAVKPDSASNDVVVRAVGASMTLSVNGTQVASVSDGTLSGGRVGVFVGGDGNQVALDHFAVQAP